jgi:hypothetical protein
MKGSRSPLIFCVSLFMGWRLIGATFCVDVNSANPVTPYSSWGNAATTIQDAINIASDGDEVVVTNGVYRTGGYGGPTNRIVVTTKAITIRSVNGPNVTSIEGARGFGPNVARCAYLSSGCFLTGFTLTNGTSGNTPLQESGYAGGVFCTSTDVIISNCLITGNYSSDFGGGVYRGTLKDCTLFGNVTEERGAGSAFSIMMNCTLVSNVAGVTLPGGTTVGSGGGAYAAVATNCVFKGNQAWYGGGVLGGTSDNCILANNYGPGGGGGYMSVLRNCTITGNFNEGAHQCIMTNCIIYNNRDGNQSDSTVDHCCTIPLAEGAGNFTNSPLFVDEGAGNFRLQPASPCINSGDNSAAVFGLDLDGNPRIAAGTVDVGAFEVQAATSTVSFAWLQQYGFATDGSADFVDPDNDGMNNWQEWRCGTIPTNSLSVLRILSVTNSQSGTAIVWQSVTNKNYFVERSTNLILPHSFQSIATNVSGLSGTATFLDNAGGNVSRSYYRVGVR